MGFYTCSAAGLSAARSCGCVLGDTDPKKYLVVPGYVISRTDGDRHFITAEQLIRLYCVKWEDCVVADGEVPIQAHPNIKEIEERYGKFPRTLPGATGAGLRREADVRGLIVLRPREDGQYPCFDPL